VHDLRLLRENVAALRDGMRRRGKLDTLGPIIDRADAVDRERRQLLQRIEERQAERNAASQEVARRKRAGAAADELIAQTRALGSDIAADQSRYDELAAELERLWYELPNLPLADVPEGGESANAIVRSWGTPRETAGVLPHWDIGAQLGILDLPRGAKITGSGFVVMRGLGARLVRALMSYMLDLHTREHGYEEVWVPFLVNRQSMTATGQLPKFEEDAYVATDDLFLIPTAEVPITNLYRDEVLDAAELPKAMTAYSACFRREAGAHGKDTRGLIRVHESTRWSSSATARRSGRRQNSSCWSPRRSGCCKGSDFRIAWCCSPPGIPVFPRQRRTIWRCGRRVSAPGSRCRRARASPTSRRAAPAFAIGRAPGKSRDWCIRSMAPASRSPARSSRCSNTTSARMAS